MFKVFKNLIDKEDKKQKVSKGKNKTAQSVKKTPKKTKPTSKSTSKTAKKNRQSPKNKLSKEKEIGRVTHCFGKISVGIIKLKASLHLGDRIHIKGVHDDFTQAVKSMQINYVNVSVASKGSEIGIKVKQRVHENDKVYKIVTE
ncbi:MAG: hypothetical protein P9M06_03435 [Candidatus Saelkia tenebricola]|nr:hypothetical protein [Candidatus Saelkia tenebricola]